MADVPLTRHKAWLKQRGFEEQPNGMYLHRLSPYLKIWAEVFGSDLSILEGGRAEHVMWLETSDATGKVLERRRIYDPEGLTRYWPSDAEIQ